MSPSSWFTENLPIRWLYLFNSTTLLLLLFNSFLSIVQKLPFVFLRVSTLSSKLGLLPLVGLGALFVLLLETLKVPSQGGLSRHIEDWTGGILGEHLAAQQTHFLESDCGLPGLSVVATVLLLFITTTVLILRFLYYAIAKKSSVQQNSQTSHTNLGLHSPINVVHSPFSPRFLRVRSMWSLSWIRTWRSVGWSLINECLSSCSVDGLLGYVFTRHPSMKSINFLDLFERWRIVPY